jgi:hypothetical protein
MTFMKKNQNDEITITEAAMLVDMSPELLNWFTTHAPKSGDNTKLPVSKHVEGMPMFKKSELVDFNKWLATPWPAPKGKRPSIPTKVRDEIIKEASKLCAFCHEHPGSCEAAHIDAVAHSKNNHPHNLIWLCASHHTAYDKGVLGPHPENVDFIKHIKGVLLGRARTVYALQAGAEREAFQLLDTCRRAGELDPTTAEQKKVAEQIGKAVLEAVAEVAKKKPTAKNKAGSVAFAKLSEITKSTAFTGTSVKKRLVALTEVREDFRLAAGMVQCPLCSGAGRRDGEDCPYCSGDGAVTQRLADMYDPHDFEYVPCPLCEGSGNYTVYDECPVCHGDCEMEKRLAELVRIDDFALAECPLCEGSGQYLDHDACPFCQGNGEVEQRHKDNFDASLYDLTECDLCEGSGVADGFEECPKCGGNGTLPGGDAERVDKRDFEMVKCPTCKGSGSGEYGDCGTCGGERRIPRNVRDNL